MDGSTKVPGSEQLLFAVCPNCNWPHFVAESGGQQVAVAIKCQNPHCGCDIPRSAFMPWSPPKQPPSGSRLPG